MIARPAGARTATPVDLRQTRISYRRELGNTKGLSSFVSGWQCRRTPAGHVLVLWYVCPEDLREDVPQALCSLTREWERYVALDGSLLDNGFSFDDARYEKLRTELGYPDKPDEAFDEGPFLSIH